MVPADTTIIDYAMPLMQIERMAKQAHDLCLTKNYKDARDLAMKMSTECRLLYVTLQIMEEREQ